MSPSPFTSKTRNAARISASSLSGSGRRAAVVSLGRRGNVPGAGLGGGNGGQVTAGE